MSLFLESLMEERMINACLLQWAEVTDKSHLNNDRAYYLPVIAVNA